ncbi:E3 ubiquitin-protein ligase RNF26 [Scleropages formosus]|uniref:E3 ubiquitin-protein ligase RNF26 n=1 Tax=Scleropages formosus TaxID=113540 RepID=A0A8C9RI28_SCLFO|nr:E3 ubiquitin-protein ligase RNF26-like [Scleropages formosus]
MALLYFVLCAFRKCLDLVCLLLDLSVWLLSALLSALHHLPLLLCSSAAGCWNLALFCALTVSEGVASAAQGSLHVLAGWLQLLGGVSESFKMLGHLLSHVLLRARELLHRGLLSGHSVLRQACDACGILLSLALYLVNTVVNMLLIGTQNCFAALAGAWEAVSGPLHEALELSLTLLTFLHSSLVGTSILLWTPCQVALEFLGSLGHVFATVFLLNVYGLVITLVIVAVVTLYLNPGLPRRGAQQVSGTLAIQRLQRALYRLYLLALERAQATLEVVMWQRTAWQGSQPGARTPQASAGAHGSDRGGRDLPDPGPAGDLAAHVQHPPDYAGWEREDDSPSEGPSLGYGSPDPSLDCPGSDRLFEGHQPLLPEAPYKDTAATTSLLTLLKEHEERKKCVICQDSAKTVLLLPCRHLCLCRACADILLCQPAPQHSCPLCRHTILHTMDVYL